MWDLPRPGLKPVFPALAGRFSTTVPLGKSQGKRLFLPVFKTGIDLLYLTSAWEAGIYTRISLKNLVCLKSLVNAQETLGTTRSCLMFKIKLH